MRILMFSVIALAACGASPEAPAAPEAPTEAPAAPAADADGQADAEVAAAPAGAPAGAPADAPPPDAEGWTTYGTPLAEGAVLTAAALMADPATHVDQTIRVQGRVTDVCQKAGCWMVIAEGEKTMRVTMKEHSFSVAKDGSGSDCVVEGVLTAKAVDPETVAHYEGESAKPEAMPEKQAKDGTVYELVATGVKLKKG